MTFRVGVQTFLSNGTYTTPTGINYIKVEVVGGGGGGGGSNSFVGGAGGGGAAPSGKFYGPGTYIYTVGVGGAGGVGAVTGADGTNTVFDTTLISNAGKGGLSAASATVLGGLGGATDAGAQYTLGRECGYAPALNQSGAGGACYFGHGGPPLFTNGVSASSGQAGLGFGAGGSGAIGLASTGGAGAPGAVIITEFYT